MLGEKMQQGSSARLVIDSLAYLEKVEKLNKGTTFFELRDQITKDWIDILKYLSDGNNFEKAYAKLHQIMQANPMMQVVPYPFYYVTRTVNNKQQSIRAPKVVDLSGRKFSLYYAMSFDRTEPPLNPIEEYVLEHKLDSVRSNNIDPENFDFIRAFTTGAAVARMSNDEFLFQITLRNMNPRLMFKVVFLLGRMGFDNKTFRDIKSNVTHELIHVLDPRRNRNRKTYNIKNSKMYTDHIIERASKLQDAFGEKFESLRKDIEKGKMANVIDEKKKFERNPEVVIEGFRYPKAKYEYVDKYIKENVDANWEASLVKRINFAPGLYHYAIKSVDKFFKRAEWDKIPLFLNKVVAKIRGLKDLDVNAYYIQKMQYTTNPGYYIDAILRGTSIVGMYPDFKTTIATNVEIFNLFFKRLNEEAFHD
jgi:hypothetical protein